MRVSTPVVFGRDRAWLLTAAQARAADEHAFEHHGIPGRVLMENAGRAAALVLSRLCPRGRVTVLAGGGNNGGDAAVLARTLRAWGRDVVLVPAATTPPDTLHHGWDVPLAGPEAIAGADVVVDGLLGTGSRGAPRGPVLDLIRTANDAGRPVLSLDVPSGVDATTGRIEGESIAAFATVTFGWAKTGLLLYPGRGRCGRLIVVDIGFPPLTEEDVDGELITPGRTLPNLPQRRANAHKGDSGRLLVLAGRPGMAGAAAIAARAATRTGAGLVRIASSPENRVILQALVPEATFLDHGALPADELTALNALLAGPGLGTDDAARTALQSALDGTAGRPALFDADALNLFAGDGALADIARSRPLVITPHPAEMARLLDCTTDDVTADAPAAAREAAQRFGCTVLLKGQPSLVAERGRPLLVNAGGSSDTAAGGMGDQLAGVIGALLAAGLEPREAAAAGLFLSSRAAEIAARGRSLGPDDVTAHLHAAFGDPGPSESPLELPFVTFDQPARR